MSSYSCTKCQCSSSQDNWLITTAFLLGITVEELKTNNRDVRIYFCPRCACPAVITWEEKELPKNEQVIIEAELISDQDQAIENFNQDSEDDSQ